MNGDASPVLERFLKRELSPDEAVLWKATPSIWKYPAFYFVLFLMAIVILLEGLLWWLGSPVLALSQVMHLPGGLLFRAMLILLVVLTILIPLLVWWMSQRTFFVVTDRRAMVIHAFFGCRSKSFTGEQLIRIERTENRQGNGSIRFGYKWAFWAIADTQRVAQILRGVFENGAKMNASSGHGLEEDLWPAQTWLFVAIGILGCAANLSFAFFLIPRFAAIVHDMVPDSKVSWTTQAVLGGKWGFVVIALLWPMAALWVAKAARKAGRQSWRHLVWLAGAVLIQFLIPTGIVLSVLFRIVGYLGGQK